MVTSVATTLGTATVAVVATAISTAMGAFAIRNVATPKMSAPGHSQFDWWLPPYSYPIQALAFRCWTMKFIRENSNQKRQIPIRSPSSRVISSAVRS